MGECIKRKRLLILVPTITTVPHPQVPPGTTVVITVDSQLQSQRGKEGRMGTMIIRKWLPITWGVWGRTQSREPASPLGGKQCCYFTMQFIVFLSQELLWEGREGPVQNTSASFATHLFSFFQDSLWFGWCGQWGDALTKMFICGYLFLISPSIQCFVQMLLRLMTSPTEVHENFPCQLKQDLFIYFLFIKS